MKLQRGYTVVELMIGITAGLIVGLAATAIAINVGAHRRDLEAVSRQVENGRYAIEELLQVKSLQL